MVVHSLSQSNNNPRLWYPWSGPILLPLAKTLRPLIPVLLWHTPSLSASARTVHNRRGERGAREVHIPHLPASDGGRQDESHRYTRTEILYKGLVINYGEEGATNWENRGSETLCTPLSRRDKTFCAPPFKRVETFCVPPSLMAKTSSYRIKTTPKLVVPPPSAWLKLCLPPPFHRGKTSRAPPLPFCSPPPPRN